nr:hypothetical protein [Tanacetum cinerariifolium]
CRGAAASVSPADVLPTAGVLIVSGSFPTEQIDAQVAREMEEELARENQRSNEVIAKHLSEYEQAKDDLSVREKIELITDVDPLYQIALAYQQRIDKLLYDLLV